MGKQQTFNSTYAIPLLNVCINQGAGLSGYQINLLEL